MVDIEIEVGQGLRLYYQRDLNAAERRRSMSITNQYSQEDGFDSLHRPTMAVIPSGLGILRSPFYGPLAICLPLLSDVHHL